MAIFTTAAGIEDLTGKLSKEDRIVMRQKKYRLPNGKIIKCRPKEAFARYSELYDRWIAQANGKSDPVTGKRYIARFINLIYSSLKIVRYD